MEDLVSPGNNESKSAASVPRRGPLISTEFVPTPSYILGQELRQKAASQPREDVVEREDGPLELPLAARLEESDSKNPLLTEVETLEVEDQLTEDTSRILVSVCVFAVIVGGYYAWKAGYLTVPKFK